MVALGGTHHGRTTRLEQPERDLEKIPITSEEGPKVTELLLKLVCETISISVIKVQLPKYEMDTPLSNKMAKPTHLQHLSKARKHRMEGCHMPLDLLITMGVGGLVVEVGPPF